MRHHPQPERSIVSGLAFWAALALPTVGVPTLAHAQSGACNIPPAGEVLCDDVVIDAPIRVSAYDATSATPTGYLHIRARSITIGEGGVIDATGSGYRTQYLGVQLVDGEGPGGGRRGSPSFEGGPAPGGGGAHLGVGGLGIDDIALCSSASSALGGVPYDDGMAPAAVASPFDLLRAMGSAGGASYCGDSGDQLRGGGRGGGVIVLTAESIDVAGRVEANGEGRAELGPNLLGCGPGAGAGGSIVLRTHNLTMGPTGSLSAAGGESPRTSDTLGMDATRTWGGGGGGGLITVFANGNPLPMANVSGGAADCAAGRGGDGALVVLAPADCVDADRDGYGSTVCGGQDCHDGVAAIGPEGVEICDGVDNDCDGEIDEDPTALCPVGSGLTCEGGACVAPSGEGGGATAPGPPPETVLGGGLCSAPGGSASKLAGGATSGWRFGPLGLVAALLWRRRRRGHIR